MKAADVFNRAKLLLGARLQWYRAQGHVIPIEIEREFAQECGAWESVYDLPGPCGQDPELAADVRSKSFARLKQVIAELRGMAYQNGKFFEAAAFLDHSLMSDWLFHDQHNSMAADRHDMVSRWLHERFVWAEAPLPTRNPWKFWNEISRELLRVEKKGIV